MNPTGKAFEVEQDGDTVIVSPVVNMSEFDFQQLDNEAKEIIQRLDGQNVLHVLIDLDKTDYIGSLSLGIFMKFWKTVSKHNGNLAVVNASDFEREVLMLAKLDTLWPICGSRQEGLEALRK